MLYALLTILVVAVAALAVQIARSRKSRPLPPMGKPSATTSTGEQVYKADRVISYADLQRMTRAEGDAWTTMAMQEVAAELGQRAPADFVVDVQVWAQDDHKRMAVIGTATLDPDWNNTDGTDDDHA